MLTEPIGLVQKILIDNVCTYYFQIWFIYLFRFDCFFFDLVLDSTWKEESFVDKSDVYSTFLALALAEM